MPAGAAGCLAAAEVLTPLLLFCWLCCWGDDDSSETSSTGPPKQTVVISYGADSPARAVRRGGSSCVSLHLPSASAAYHAPLSAHRSDEALASRRGAAGAARARGAAGAAGAEGAEGAEGVEGRYHSAPSVIDEVLARRTWCRSQEIPRRESIPLVTGSPPRAESEDSQISCEPSTSLGRAKHKHNIVNSNKESTSADIKDEDATENVTYLYISDGRRFDAENPELSEENPANGVKVKEVKQNFNESLRSRIGLVKVEEFIEAEFPDRSGATHRAAPPYAAPGPRGCDERAPSVEPVDYSAASCYLQQPLAEAAGAAGAVGAVGGGGGRHASDGDILAPARRPQSGAFSESEVIESVGREVTSSSPRRKETAI